MNRREFISWVGVGSIASSLPIALAACSNQDTAVQPATAPQAAPPAAPAPRADGFVAIGAVADLDQKGQLSQKINDKAVVVVRSADAKALLAVDSICTHQGCAVEWQKGDKAFVCPCHNAKFASDGKVLGGPAPSPLKTFIAKIDGDQVLVKVV
jgi:cytochrome b6-f complex iron-sulfur subunit